VIDNGDKMEPKRKILVISLEGNIGSGKSTIIDKLRENNNNGVYPFMCTRPPLILSEPVDQWEDELPEFYKDRTKSPRSLQEKIMFAIIRYVKENVESTKTSVIITERSVLSSQYIFAKNLLQNGEMVKEDYDLLADLLNSFDNMYKPSVIVYIRTSPEKCLERIRTRSRNGEQDIDPQYIANLHEIHEQWILSMAEEVSNHIPLLPTSSESYPFLRISNTPLVLDNNNDGIESTEAICYSIMSYVANLIIEDYNDYMNL